MTGEVPEGLPPGAAAAIRDALAAERQQTWTGSPRSAASSTASWSHP